MNKKNSGPEENKNEEESVSQNSGEITLDRHEYDLLMQQLNELKSHKENLLRSAADFENAKKRLAREREDFLKFGQENLVRSLLPVLDNFERGLSHAEDPNVNMKSIVSGIQMVLKQLNEILKNQGLKRLETVGHPFDPHLHEALGYVHEKGEPDQIVQEIEPGYMLHDRLLRAAKVRVRMPESPN